MGRLRRDTHRVVAKRPEEGDGQSQDVHSNRTRRYKAKGYRSERAYARQQKPILQRLHTLQVHSGHTRRERTWVVNGENERSEEPSLIKDLMHVWCFGDRDRVGVSNGRAKQKKRGGSKTKYSDHQTKIHRYKTLLRPQMSEPVQRNRNSCEPNRDCGGPI